MKLHSANNFNLLLVVIVILLGGLIVLSFHILTIADSISGAVVDNNFVPMSSSSDGNFTAEHFSLAGNQVIMLQELRALNLFSQCVVDTESIVTREVPIDDQGGFRRVSIVSLVCPEIQEEVRE